jgi:DNA-binding transcriptional ArsR family regulator
MKPAKARRPSAGSPASGDAMRENADAAALLLKMLANGQRLRVLCLLAGGELSVRQINERVDLSQSALSQHLAKLREEGLVTTRRQSQAIYYRLSSGPARRIISSLYAIYCGTDAAAASRRRRPAKRA